MFTDRRERMKEPYTAANDPSESGQPLLIYPAIVPPEDGHPTSADFEVVNTRDDRGRGLRTRRLFRRGERVAMLSGILVHHATLDTIQVSPTMHIHDRWFCRFLLHSCDPNLAIDVRTMEARATREIDHGEYLSIDYAATEDVL